MTQAAATRSVPAVNPLLTSWKGEFGGLPPFDEVELEHFEPAFATAMAEQLAEVDRIVREPGSPSFENTVVALERSGRALDRVAAIYEVWRSNLSTPALQAVAKGLAPRLAAHRDRIYQNAALFGRIDVVFASADAAGLGAEDARLLERCHTEFVRSGARLGGAEKERVAEINARLAELFREFADNLLADESERMIVLEAESELAGLPDAYRRAAAEEAADRGVKGGWVVANTRSAVQPFLTFSDRRDLRERVWRMFVGRGNSGGPTDNETIVAEILALRAERARLLGYATHAHYRTEDQMAKTPGRAMELMAAVWDPAVARVRADVADLRRIMESEGIEGRVEPWDHRYYAEKARRERFALDKQEITQYLRLDRLEEALFWLAGELFGFDFERDRRAPAFHPDVEVWRVRDRSTGGPVGLLYFDPFARPGKRSGAWMNSYRNQERLDGEVLPIVAVSTNYLKGAPRGSVLLSWEEALTLFHEFGHALNGLASDVTYGSLAGTPPERDYVEFPSQLLEHWLSTPEVLRRFATHHATGEPIPRELVDRIERAANFNQGFETVEYLASALVDMKVHLAGERPIDPARFERETLVELGMPDESVMRHRLPHFSHVFGSDNYSATYYGYLWADVLTADAFEAFQEGGGPFDLELFGRLREHVFSKGSSVEPAEAYRRFRGRDARVDALLRKRGLVEA